MGRKTWHERSWEEDGERTAGEKRNSSEDNNLDESGELRGVLRNSVVAGGVVGSREDFLKWVIPYRWKSQ